MADEIFDVVDEHDLVIGRETRREVHRRGLRHRAAHILIFNHRGEVFLQKRSMQKDSFPGAWDSSASGHLDCGEDYDACAVRELREELGLDLREPLRKLFKIDACPETCQEFVWVYQGHAEGPFQLHPDEIERGEWFSPEKITAWIQQNPADFASAFRKLWTDIRLQSEFKKSSKTS
jgi:isopentenyldiphosphate isomerase